MSTGSARPLEDAYRISQHDLVTWAAELTGWDMLDAYQLVSQAGLAPAGNVVDTNYTMVAKLAKTVPRPGAVRGRRRARPAPGDRGGLPRPALRHCRGCRRVDPGRHGDNPLLTAACEP